MLMTESGFVTEAGEPDMNIYAKDLSFDKLGLGLSSLGSQGHAPPIGSLAGHSPD